MQTYMKALTVLATLALAAGCTPPTKTKQREVHLELTSIAPKTVFTEGGEPVVVETTNGCAVDKMTLKVGNVTVTGVEKLADNKYTFAAPTWAEGVRREVDVVMECAEHPDPKKFKYGRNSATIKLVYDPTLVPAPSVKAPSPAGERISVLAKMSVTFTREMNPDTLRDDTVYIEGVQGSVEYFANTNTAVFTPTQQLAYGQTYTCIVKGGESGVRGKSGKALKLEAGANQAQYQWTFTTRREGEGNPWVGDISAAAGISEGGGYKLFSVTGQPTPVGEAYAGTKENHTYKLQSGFIYAAQPPSAQ